MQIYRAVWHGDGSDKENSTEHSRRCRTLDDAKKYLLKKLMDNEKFRGAVEESEFILNGYGFRWTRVRHRFHGSLAKRLVIGKSD